MLLQTVIEVVYINFYSQSSLKSATNCCQMEREIQQGAWGSVCFTCVSQQCLHKNCPQLLKKNIGYLRTLTFGMEISCLGSYAHSYFETFIQSPKQFLN